MYRVGASDGRGGGGGWVAPEVAGMFHFVHVDPLLRDELTEVLVGLYPELEGSEPLEQIVGLKDRWVGRRIRWTGGRDSRSRCGRSGTCAGGWWSGGGGGGQWGFVASYSRRADDGSHAGTGETDRSEFYGGLRYEDRSNSIWKSEIGSYFRCALNRVGEHSVA